VEAPLAAALAQVESSADLPPGLSAAIFFEAAVASRRDRSEARRWLERAMDLEAQISPDDRSHDPLRREIAQLAGELGVRAPS
jgi:hypothetical protein